MIINENDKAHLRSLVTKRRQHKQAHWTRRKSTEWSDEALDFLGLKGEFVFSKLADLPMDENSYILGDAGFDFTGNDVKIGVKTNHRSNGFLFFERESDFEKIDIVVLCNGSCTPENCFCSSTTDEQFNLSGWTTKEEFFRLSKTKDFGYGKRWLLAQDKLRNIQELLSALKNGTLQELIV